MNTILRNPTPSAIISSIEANLFAFFRNTSRCSAFEVHDKADILWTITDVRSWSLFNSLMRAQLDDEEVNSTLETAIRRARSRNVSLMWWVGPSSSPADLGSRLQAHGFASAGDAPGMAMALQGLPTDFAVSADLTIKEVRDIGSLSIWSHISAVGFGMPDDAEVVWLDLFRAIGLGEDTPIRHYLGWLKGEPVATSTMLLDAGVAGIYNVATLPQARRQGIGTAMTLAPLRDAVAQGCHIAILQSSKMGIEVYRRIGFRKHCAFHMYTWSEKGHETSTANNGMEQTPAHLSCNTLPPKDHG